jgi:hypothetical protein
MTNERLYQFPNKASPIPADIVYVGDSTNTFNEVYCTIAEIIAAYPNLSGIAGLTLSANTFPYSNNSNVITAGSITALAVSLLADSTQLAMQTTLGLVIGTNVQAYSPLLTAIAALTPAANSVIAGNGSTFIDYVPTTQEVVYVTSNGNDSTGNGSLLFPFLTIGHALSTITTSSSVNPYVVKLGAGTYSETGLEIPVWVFLVGDAQQPTKIIDSSGAIKINSASFSAGSERIGFFNLNLINSTGITIDFQAIGGAGSNQIYMNNNQIVGPVIFRGRGSDFYTGFENKFFGAYTSSGMQENHYVELFNNTVTFNTSGVTSTACSSEFTACTFFSSLTFTSSGAGNTLTPEMISSPVSGTLTVDQATTTLSADEVSLNAGTLSQTNGGLITYLSIAKYEGYTPAVPGNWSPVPTQVAQALDELATRNSSGTLPWTVVTVSTPLVKSNGYFSNSAGALNFTLPVVSAVGDTFAIANMNTGNFTIVQNAGQSVIIGDITTTVGAGGSIASTRQGDGLTLVCNVANTGFQVMPGYVGNLTVV